MSSVDPSEKWPVAVICCVCATTSATGSGVTSIVSNVALVTESETVPILPGSTAESVADPAAIPLTRPTVPAAFDTLAMLGFDEDHSTSDARLRVEPSL